MSLNPNEVTVQEYDALDNNERSALAAVFFKTNPALIERYKGREDLVQVVFNSKGTVLHEALNSNERLTSDQRAQLRRSTEEVNYSLHLPYEELGLQQ